MTDKNKRIIDVALDFGFSSRETFTRAFKDAYGITPEEYRAKPVRLNQIMKPELLLNYTMIDEDAPLITDSIVLEITRRTLKTLLTRSKARHCRAFERFGKIIATALQRLHLWNDSRFLD